MHRRSLAVTPRQFLIIVFILTLLAASGPGLAYAADEYQCSNCNRMITVPPGQEIPKKCPHCGVRFDWIREPGKMSQQIKHEQPVSNGVILGVLCLLVSLGVVGGGVFLLVKLLSGPKKRPKRRRRDDFDDDDFDDDDDRPRRRRRNREDD